MKTHPNFVSWFGALQNVLRLVRMFSVYRSSNLHWSQPIPITMGTVEELDIKMQKVKVLEVVYKDKILKCIGLNTFRLHSNMTPILVFSFQVCHIFKIENQTNFCKNLNALSLLSYISPWKGNIYLWQLSQFEKIFPNFALKFSYTKQIIPQCGYIQDSWTATSHKSGQGVISNPVRVPVIYQYH